METAASISAGFASSGKQLLFPLRIPHIYIVIGAMKAPTPAARSAFEQKRLRKYHIAFFVYVIIQSNGLPNYIFSGT